MLDKTLLLGGAAVIFIMNTATGVNDLSRVFNHPIAPLAAVLPVYMVYKAFK